MSNLTTVNPAELQVHTTSGLMGVTASVTANDVTIPSLILMQSNSTIVQDKDDINSGDFLHSISGEVWGRKDKEKVELVFFDMFKTQIVSDVTGGKKKWIETLPWEPAMEKAPYELTVENQTLRYEQCFNYCVYRRSDLREVEKPDGSTGYIASPIVVKFKGGSHKHGKKLNQLLVDYAAFGAPSWATSFFLTATQEEKDGSKYWAYSYEKGEQTTKGEQMAAELLCKQMQDARQAGVINVVDSEESGEAERNVTPEPQVKNYAPQTAAEAQQPQDVC